MSNVVPFHRPAPLEPQRGCDVVTVADELIDVLARIEDLAGQAALMDQPTVKVERTVQNLLDALCAMERALDCIGEGNEDTPT